MGAPRPPGEAARRGLSLCLLLAISCPSATVADTADPCHPAFEQASHGDTGRVVDIEGEADLLLEDGRLLELAGLTRWNSDVGAWLRAEVVGRRLTVRTLGAPRDRWGRVPALAAAVPPGDTPAGGARSLHALAVEAGFVVVTPSGLPPACARSLLAREAAARADGRGRWAPGAVSRDALEPPPPEDSPSPTPPLAPRPSVAHGVIAATDRSALEAQKGRFVIVEGRVTSVGERATVDYINFGSDFRRDLAATSSKALSRALAAAGTPVASLRGRLVRVRGLVEGRNALLLRLDGPTSVEILDEAEAARSPPVEPRAPSP